MTRTPKPATFGDRIKKARLDAGMTQAELARAIGRSNRNDVRKLEQKQSTKTLDTIKALAEATGVSAAWLAFGDEK